MRLIDADSLVIQEDPEIISGNFLQGFYAGQESAIKEILEAPTIDAEPVRHGRWLISEVTGEQFCCSRCGGACWYYDYKGNVARSSYCPNCGAKMDLEDTDDA